MPSAKDAIERKLYEGFPGEAANLARFFREAEKCYRLFTGPIFDQRGANEDADMADFIRGHVGKSYKDLIDGWFGDQKLRSIFYAPWPSCGVSPAHASAAFCLMMFVMHWQEGSHYCRGGFQSLAAALASVIESCGGAIRTGSCTRRG